MVMTISSSETVCPECGGTHFIENLETQRTRVCGCVLRENAKKRLNSLGIDQEIQKIRINDYMTYDHDTKRAKTLALAYVKKFDNINSWLAFLGQSGSGKTFLSIAIGMELLHRPNPIIITYMPYLDAMRELKASAGDNENYLRVQEKYLTTKLLIIDDLFKDKVRNGKLIAGLSEADIKHITPIINNRVLRKQKTIINSECTIQQLIELDESFGGKVRQMCSDGDSICQFQGIQHNYRLNNRRMK